MEPNIYRQGECVADSASHDADDIDFVVIGVYTDFDFVLDGCDRCLIDIIFEFIACVRTR